MEIVTMKSVVFSFLAAGAFGLAGLVAYFHAGTTQAAAQPAPTVSVEASCCPECPDCPDCPCPDCPDCPDCCSTCPLSHNVASKAMESGCCTHAKPAATGERHGD